MVDFARSVGKDAKRAEQEQEKKNLASAARRTGRDEGTLGGDCGQKGTSSDPFQGSRAAIICCRRYMAAVRRFRWMRMSSRHLGAATGIPDEAAAACISACLKPPKGYPCETLDNTVRTPRPICPFVCLSASSSIDRSEHSACRVNTT